MFLCGTNADYLLYSFGAAFFIFVTVIVEEFNSDSGMSDNNNNLKKSFRYILAEFHGVVEPAVV